ncbi:MAG: hypothetical protein ACXACB_12025, partial [Promethearchaeota archaeon]
MPSFLSPTDKTKLMVVCQYCKYKIAKPFPKDNLCPKCSRFLAELHDLATEGEKKPEPQQFETKTSTLSSKFKGKVKIKEKPLDISLDHDMIELRKEEYVKLLGITSVDRTQLFCSNKKYNYLLELTNNLDFIARDILGGGV